MTRSTCRSLHPQLLSAVDFLLQGDLLRVGRKISNIILHEIVGSKDDGARTQDLTNIYAEPVLPPGLKLS